MTAAQRFRVLEFQARMTEFSAIAGQACKLLVQFSRRDQLAPLTEEEYTLQSNAVEWLARSQVEPVRRAAAGEVEYQDAVFGAYLQGVLAAANAGVLWAREALPELDANPHAHELLVKACAAEGIPAGEFSDLLTVCGGG